MKTRHRKSLERDENGDKMRSVCKASKSDAPPPPPSNSRAARFNQKFIRKSGGVVVLIPTLHNNRSFTSSIDEVGGG